MKRKALVIDDDYYMRELLSELLTEEGFEVDVAADGTAGLRMFARGKPDLVILDTIMPDVEGVETLRCITQLNPYVPVVAISSGGKIGVKACLETMTAFGARAGLPKPICIPQFVATVRLLCGIHHSSASPTAESHESKTENKTRNEEEWAELEPLQVTLSRTCFVSV